MTDVLLIITALITSALLTRNGMRMVFTRRSRFVGHAERAFGALCAAIGIVGFLLTVVVAPVVLL